MLEFKYKNLLLIKFHGVARKYYLDLKTLYCQFNKIYFCIVSYDHNIAKFSIFIRS